jgi:ComF family protein
MFCGRWLWRKYYCHQCCQSIVGYHYFYVENMKVHGACAYNPLTCQPILNLKYNNNPFMAQPIAEFIMDKVTIPWDYDYLIPIPMAPLKFITRGYNQSLLMAQRLSGKTKIPVMNILKKLDNKSQKDKTVEQRWIPPALGLNAPISHKKILLVDDVITTGTTLLAAYNLLKDKNQVEAVVFNYSKKFIGIWGLHEKT